LRERDDAFPKASGATVVRMKIFEVLACPECAVVEQILLTLRGKKVRRLGWDMSQPPAHSLDKWVFTIFMPSFSIIEQSPKGRWRVPAL
jgi:hypothetical protein